MGEDDLRNRLVASLAASRRASGVSQVELARRLGKPQSYVSKIERGERGLDVAEYVTLARAIGINPFGLLMVVSDPETVEDAGWAVAFSPLDARPIEEVEDGS